MPLRDLGYRPYDGARLPASHNGIVFYRHALRRAWASWLLKIAVFLGWIPAAIHIAVVVIRYALGNALPVPPGAEDTSASTVASLLGWQLWIFVPLATSGVGACAIAEDIELRAFRFYLAKPLSVVQYVVGRFGAAVTWSSVLCVVPAILVVLALIATAPEGERLARLGLLFPALLASATVGIVLGVASVAISAIGRSRALTMTAWLALLFVPHTVGWILERATGSPWTRAASLPYLLEVATSALFRTTEPRALAWPYAAALLAGASLLGAAYVLRRVRRAEVVA